jgi:hypothetical protein
VTHVMLCMNDAHSVLYVMKHSGTLYIELTHTSTHALLHIGKPDTACYVLNGGSGICVGNVALAGALRVV